MVHSHPPPRSFPTRLLPSTTSFSCLTSAQPIIPLTTRGLFVPLERLRELDVLCSDDLRFLRIPMNFLCLSRDRDFVKF